jgi:hypothetical protein
MSSNVSKHELLRLSDAATPGQLTVTYENDTTANGEGFYEWWAVGSAKFDSEADAIFYASAVNYIRSSPFREATAPAAASPNTKDAQRWRALIGCQRIRVLGSAGIETPKEDNYAHLGLELWTLHPTNDDHKLGADWLTRFADIAVATIADKEI